MLREQDDEHTMFDQTSLLGNGSVTKSRRRTSAVCGKKFGTFALCGAFFGVGLSLAIPGPTLNYLRCNVGATLQSISYIFPARSFGYFIGSAVGGVLFDRFAHKDKLLVSLALILAAITIAVAPWTSSLTVLCILLSITSIAMGFLDTAGNVICLKMWGKESGPYMQALHFSFGVGACIAPLVAAPFLNATGSSCNATILLDYSTNSTTWPTYTPEQRPKRQLPGNWSTPENTLSTSTYPISTEIVKNFTPITLPITTPTLGLPDTTPKLELPVTTPELALLPAKPSNTGTHISDDLNTASGNHLNVEIENAKQNPPDIVKDIKTTASVTSASAVNHTPASTVNHTIDSTAIGNDSAAISATNNDTAAANISELAANTGLDPVTNATHNQPVVNSAISVTAAVTRPTEYIITSEPTRTVPSSAVTTLPNTATEPSSAVTTPPNTMTVSSSAVTTLPNTATEPSSAVTTLPNTATEPSSAVTTPPNTATEPSSAVTTLPNTAPVPSSAVTTPPNTTTVSSSAVTTLPNTATVPSSAITTLPNTATVPSSVVTTLPNTATVPSSAVTTLPNTATVSSSAITTLPNTATVPSSAITTLPYTTTAPSSAATEPSSAVTTLPSPTAAPFITTAIPRRTTTSITTLPKTATVTTTIIQPLATSLPTPVPTKVTVPPIVTIAAKDSANTTVSNEGKSLLERMETALYSISKVQFSYLVVGAVMLVFGFIFCCLGFSESNNNLQKSENDLNEMADTDMAATPSLSYKMKLMSAAFVFFFLYVGTEVAYGQFIATFGIHFNGFSERKAAFLTAVYWGTFALARGMCVLISRCLSPAVMLTASISITLFSAIGLSVATTIAGSGAGPVWVLSGALGFGMAAIFPTGVLWIEKYITVTGKMAAVFVCGSALGEMLIPAVVGYFMEHKGPTALIIITLVCVIGCGFTFCVMRCIASTKRSQYRKVSSDKFSMQQFEFSDSEETDSEPMIKRNGTRA